MSTMFARGGGIVASVAALAAIASAQTIATPTNALESGSVTHQLNPVPLSRINIESFGRIDDPIIFAEAVDTSGGSTSIPWWDNGACDNITAHLSQVGSVDDFCTADDCFIKAGQYAYTDEVRVIFAVDTRYNETMNKPTFKLAAYGDCDGRPDTTDVRYTVTDPLDINFARLGPAPWLGFDLWAVSFDVDVFSAVGPDRVWLCPQGCGELADGFYYWVSANMGVIQGAMAQIKNNAQPWQDVQTCDCPGLCTDMCLTITGHDCCLLKNNMPFDPNGGAASIQLFGANIDTQRAADNFQIGPSMGQEICAVEAWMATNCPLDKVFLEIYDNNCDMPDKKICVIDLTGDDDGDGVQDFPLVEDTGVDYLGCNVYRFWWPNITRVLLPPGQDYWISVVARSAGSALDKAYWMYKAVSACHINITEGKVKDPFVLGLEDFTFVSIATSGAPRDFAFKIYTRDDIARVQEGSVPDFHNNP